jgi:RNA polymerase sigma-70 factor (ECF subfamily)
MGLSGEDAEDALHEVFLVWHRRRESFDAKRGTMKSWLFGIAANVVRSERRKRRRADPHPDAQDCFGGSGTQRSLVAEGSWRAIDGSAQTATGDLRRALERAISELPPEHRAVFVMFEVEGVDCTSIARDLGIPVGTVYSRLHTSRHHLQAALAVFRGGADSVQSKGRS